MSIASTIARAHARTHRRRARDASPRTSSSRARETVCFASEPAARRPLDDAMSVFLRRGRLAPIAFDLAPVVAVAVRAFASSDALVASANAVLLFWLAQVCDSEHILCLDRRVYFYICSSAFRTDHILYTFCRFSSSARRRGATRRACGGTPFAEGACGSPAQRKVWERRWRTRARRSARESSSRAERLKSANASPRSANAEAPRRTR